MAAIDVKFMKGNKQTLKAMSTTYKNNPKPKKSAQSTQKGKK